MDKKIEEANEVILALSSELRQRWTQHENPCLCSTFQVFARYKKQIESAESSMLDRIKKELRHG